MIVAFPGGRSMSVRSSALARALCWVGLALHLACAWHLAGVGAFAPGEGPEAFPARVDGVEVRSPAEAAFRGEATAPGGQAVLERAGVARVVPVVPAHGPAYLAITALTALAFWLACLLAFAGRADTEPARSFFWASFVYGLAIAAGGVHRPAAPAAVHALPSLLRIAALSVAPALFVRIAFLFPRRDPRWPRLRAGVVLAALAVLAAVAQIAAYLGAVAGADSASFARWQAAERAGQALTVALVALGIVQLVRNTRAAELSRERRQAKWIGWGVALGAVPFAALYALPKALGAAPLVPIEAVRLLAILVPVSFAIAVARDQFMDIDVIIRRSLIYGAIAGVLTLVYLGAGLVLGRLFAPADGPAPQIVGLGAAALAVALFAPTESLGRRAVDRTFFRLRTDLDRARRGIAGELAPAVTPGDLAARVASIARAALGPKTARVVLAGDDERAASLGATIAAADRTSRPEIERARLPEAWIRDGVVVAQPLAGSERAHGALLLGEKASERRWVDEELDFLDALGREAGRTLERLELARAAAEQAEMRARQVEVDRMKSAFLAQVAHDLRTPVTSILWSSQNLIDGLAGPLPERAAEGAESIRAAARQLRTLVENLLEIARLEGDPSAPAPVPTDARRVVDEVVLALRPLADRRAIRVCVRAADALPCVAASPEGLARIVFNLLDNALKFAPESSAVEIALAPEREDWVRIEVHDDGPGIAADERDRIWGRYERGRAAGGAAVPGFGLGLSIVRAWVARFGGRVEAEAPAAGGTTFVCRLRPFPTEATWPTS
jgi:signal transduction histidine kinase